MPKIKTLNIDEVMKAAERDDNTGFCIACGHEVQGVEPDARHYECEICGKKAVFGAEEILLQFS
jgi:predicted RNA-binding Zn-ribbon protein involved in translation (DUF1610 family)